MSNPRSILNVLVFTTLSLTDLLLTWWLIERSGRLIQEGNPLADWCLSSYGWSGLAGFKIGMVGLVILLTHVIARKQPAAAKQLLRFACVLLTLVVCYSAVLGRTAKTPAEVVAEVNRDFAANDPYARAMHQDTLAYSELLNRVVDDLLTQRCTLAAALDRLLQWKKNQDPVHRRALLAVFGGRTVEECLARQLMEFVAASEHYSTGWGIEEQYAALFGNCDPSTR